MSRPSPQEQAKIDAASEMVDCRACSNRGEVRDGVSCDCLSGATPEVIPWAKVVCGMCSDFSPASPPVSADREGTDLLTAAREYLHATGRRLKCPAYWQAKDGEPQLHVLPGGVNVPAPNCPACALRRAISSEEARRARPDPKDAAIRELVDAAAGIRRYAVGDYFGNRAYAVAVERYESALLLPSVVAARFSKTAPTVEDPRDATIRAATLLEVAGDLDNRADRARDGAYGPAGAVALLIQGYEQLATVLRARAELALRSAGVEPTPEGQETKP